VPQEQRQGLLANYQEYTCPGGLNALSVIVSKPFIPEAPDAEKASHKWISGELLTYYRDWRIEFCSEEIFDCMSSGVHHQHAVNRMLARKEPDQRDGIGGFRKV
jgi:tellurite methyltransferase